MSKNKPNIHLKNSAQELAIQGLQYLVTQPEDLGQFLAACGIGPQNLREAAKDTGFLIGVLDFILENELRIIKFSDFAQTEPHHIMIARNALGGTWERDIP